MAEQLFKEHPGGATLHWLRHSRLTHLGDQNVSAPLLMAISGHKQLATLQQYVKPSQAAVAKLMADTLTWAGHVPGGGQAARLCGSSEWKRRW